jgi:hypothetical protein
MTSDEPSSETVTPQELARLRRIEEAAKSFLSKMERKPSATTMLTAMAELRVALREDPS